MLLLQRLMGQDLPLIDDDVADDSQVLYAALEQNTPIVDIHASGTAMRFLTAYYAVADGETHIIRGTARMHERPIGYLVEALRSLGAEIDYLEHEGYPPLRIGGHHLCGGRVSLPGNVSSQFVSALLMIAPLFDEGLVLHIEGGITSKSYIDLTLSLMAEYGAQASWSTVDTISVEPRYGMGTPAAFIPESDANEGGKRRLAVEADWSAASYWYEMLALYSRSDAGITLNGLYDSSRQGDATVRHLFSALGVKSRFMPPVNKHVTPLELRCSPNCVKNLVFHFAGQPDLVPTFVVTCCLKGVHFHFSGLSSLRYKESNRIQALLTEMCKLGYIIEEDGSDGLKWEGQRCQPQPCPVIETYEDHRMAMAFAPAAICTGKIAINHPEVVEKSYPTFWKHLSDAGFTIEITE